MRDFATEMRLAGFTVAVVDRLLDEGHGYMLGGSTLYAAPLTAFQIMHEGRYPFESRYTRGARELELERRRKARA